MNFLVIVECLLGVGAERAGYQLSGYGRHEQYVELCVREGRMRRPHSVNCSKALGRNCNTGQYVP